MGIGLLLVWVFLGIGVYCCCGFCLWVLFYSWVGFVCWILVLFCLWNMGMWFWCGWFWFWVFWVLMWVLCGSVWLLVVCDFFWVVWWSVICVCFFGWLVDGCWGFRYWWLVVCCCFWCILLMDVGLFLCWCVELGFDGYLLCFVCWVLWRWDLFGLFCLIFVSCVFDDVYVVLCGSWKSNMGL